LSPNPLPAKFHIHNGIPEACAAANGGIRPKPEKAFENEQPGGFVVMETCRHANDRPVKLAEGGKQK
jgi:hypothetical protein